MLYDTEPSRFVVGAPVVSVNAQPPGPNRTHGVAHAVRSCIDWSVVARSILASADVGRAPG
jgi:hypothetical protein